MHRNEFQIFMKQIVFILILLTSGISLAQQTGLIAGKLTDAESNNEGLIFANISIKGTSIQTDTDTEGFFKFEGLKDGTYTLLCSFSGYETKEVVANVFSGKVTEVTTALNASTVSLDDLMSLASAEDKPLTASK